MMLAVTIRLAVIPVLVLIPIPAEASVLAAKRLADIPRGIDRIAEGIASDLDLRNARRSGFVLIRFFAAAMGKLHLVFALVRT